MMRTHMREQCGRICSRYATERNGTELRLVVRNNLDIALRNAHEENP